MAISQMAKMIVISHRTEASQLLEALQNEGICEVLTAQEAAVSRDLPEPAAAERPKDVEQFLNRLAGSISFLKGYAESAKGIAGILAPRAVIDERAYNRTIADEQIPQIVERCERCQKAIERARAECDRLGEVLEKLQPWRALESAVEEITELKTSVCLAGLISTGQFEKLTEQISRLGAAVQTVGISASRYACVVVCLKESSSEVHKLLRSAEFEPVSFEGFAGTVTKLIKEHRERLNQTQKRLRQLSTEAASLSANLLKLEILHDHYENLLNKEQARASAPATEKTVILEGWVREKDYGRLEQIVSRFGASAVSRVQPAEDEEPPVEIENKNIVKPFEVITRLYGMPRHFEVDPTVFLAPFFAIFFALCLTDAGYGIVIIALMLYFIKRTQGDKKLMWMLGICSAFTVVAGALTGGWFGDAVQQFAPALKPVREKLMWFDPLEKPMTFFALSLALGYLQILTGLLIAFAHNLKRKNYIAAVCDQLTWLVMLNSIVIYGAGKAGYLSAEIGGFFGRLALVPAAAILLFSQRGGPLAGRLGMGAYSLFSTIFYMGDILSYLRLMALGMVTAGLAMAINIIAKIALGAPYGIGFILVILILIGGHSFNIAINALGAFVHTLRLQYVEFFPKFLVGGGRLFEPLSKKYRHIYINK